MFMLVGHVYWLLTCESFKITLTYSNNGVCVCVRLCVRVHMRMRMRVRVRVRVRVTVCLDCNSNCIRETYT